MKNNKGFTLIEVILAITILSTLSVISTIATSRALKSKRKIQTEVETVGALRDSMRIIRNDINLAYNHSDFELDILDESKKKTAPPAAAPQPGLGGQPVPPPPPEIPKPSNRTSPATYFVGDEKSINFVTMNNGRMSANEAQADFIEVGYFLKNCNIITGDQGRGEPTKKSQGTNCLYRRTQKIIDQDVTQGGIETMMIDDVTEFSLKYLVEGKLDWLKEWKANKKRYNIFPDAVEVTLAIEKEFEGKSKKYSIQYVIPVHFPNNYSPKTKNEPQTNSSGEFLE